MQDRVGLADTHSEAGSSGAISGPWRAVHSSSSSKLRASSSICDSVIRLIWLSWRKPSAYALIDDESRHAGEINGEIAPHRLEERNHPAIPARSLARSSVTMAPLSNHLIASTGTTASSSQKTQVGEVLEMVQRRATGNAHGLCVLT